MVIMSRLAGDNMRRICDARELIRQGQAVCEEARAIRLQCEAARARFKQVVAEARTSRVAHQTHG
jgi:hypothetical protein